VSFDFGLRSHLRCHKWLSAQRIRHLHVYQRIPSSQGRVWRL